MSVMRTVNAPSGSTLSKFNELHERVIAIHLAYRGPFLQNVEHSECDCILNECARILYAIESTGDPPNKIIGLREGIADVHARLLTIRNSVMGTTSETNSDIGIDTLIHEANLIICFLNQTSQPTAVVRGCTLI